MNQERGSHWWSLSKAEQKQQIEQAVDWYLSQDGDLSDIQVTLLRDAIGHTFRGLFGMARQDVFNLGRPESDWGPIPRHVLMIDGISTDTLRRALALLRETPVQERPVFT
jgi:hypothetical protein